MVQEVEQSARVDRLWTVGPGVVLGVIQGPIPTKSNQRKVALVGPPDKKRMLFIKSDKARDYEARFLKVASFYPGVGDSLNGHEKLFLRATVYQENLRRDLDCELLPDLLQKAGVIHNDRLIWVKHYERQIDKENPRVEFEIGVMEVRREGHG